MSGLMLVTSVILFFAGTTAIMIFLFMRAPIIEEFDESPSPEEILRPEATKAPDRTITQDRHRRHGTPKPMSTDTRPLYTPHTRPASSAAGSVNLRS